MQSLRYSKYTKGIIILLDIVIITWIFVFFFIQRSKELKIKENTGEQNILSVVLLSLFWILLSGRTKLYSIPRNLTYTLYLERFVTQMLIFLFGIILLGKVSDNPFIKNERFWLAFSLFTILLILKSIIFFGLKYIRSLGINYRNVMFLGNPTDSREILERTIRNRKDYGFKIHDYSSKEIDFEKLVQFWKEKGIHTLFIPLENSGFSETTIERISSEAELHKIHIALIPNNILNNFFEYDINYLETQPFLVPTKFPLDYFTNFIIKRLFDLIFSVLLLIFIGLWLFPIIALLIKIDSRGPIFFKQKRYGFHDEVFRCIKFRTMVVNEASTSKTTEENDIRITKIGQFLRKTSIDELPQFFNVLKGEMSIVGPRPHMLLIDNFYKEKIGKYTIRSLVMPGITGLAQVNGLRGDAGDMNIEMKKRILADSFYVKNWSIVLDLIIIFKTIFLLIVGDKKAR